jgi:hypothetical protein
MKFLIRHIVIGIFACFLLSGCSKTDSVALVKNGTLEIDKSVTVGNAFDHYQYFKSTSWDAGEDEQKRTIVTFTGKFDLDKIKGTYDLFQITDDDIAKAKQANLDCNFVTQFKIGADRESFEVGFCGIHVSKTVNGQAESFNWPENDNGNGELQAIYQNGVSATVAAQILACSGTTNNSSQ